MKHLYLVLGLLILGCSSKIIKVEVPVETIKYEKVFEHDTITVKEVANCDKEIKTIKVIYFNFDSYELSNKAKAILDNVDISKTVVIKAHTCDIGTFEYNRGLRMRRGDTVHKYLYKGDYNKGVIIYDEDQCTGRRISCRNVEIVTY